MRKVNAGAAIVEFIDEEEVAEFLLRLKGKLSGTSQEYTFLNGVLWNNSEVIAVDPPIDKTDNNTINSLKFKKFPPEGEVIAWYYTSREKRLTTSPTIPNNAVLVNVDPPMWLQFCSEGVLLTRAYLWCNDPLARASFPWYRAEKYGDAWLILLAWNDLPLPWLNDGGLFLFKNSSLKKVTSRKDFDWVPGNKVFETPKVVIEEYHGVGGTAYVQKHRPDLMSERLFSEVREDDLRPLKIMDTKSSKFIYMPAYYFKPIRGVFL